MKKLLLVVLFLSFSGVLFAQIPADKKITARRADYIKMSLSEMSAQVSYGPVNYAVVKNGSVVKKGLAHKSGIDDIVFRYDAGPGYEGQCLIDPEANPDHSLWTCSGLNMKVPLEDIVSVDVYFALGPSAGEDYPKADSALFHMAWINTPHIISVLKSSGISVIFPWWDYAPSEDDEAVVWNNKYNFSNYYTLAGKHPGTGDDYYLINRGIYTWASAIELGDETIYKWFDIIVWYMGDPPPSVSVKRTADAKGSVIEQVPGTNTYKTKAHRLELIDALGRILKSVEGPEKPLTIEEAGAYYLRAREKNGRVAGSKGVIKTR